MELRLGTCWVGAFDAEKLANYLEVPAGRVVTVCMSLGYPDEAPEARSRKPMNDLVFWNGYGKQAE